MKKFFERSFEIKRRDWFMFNFMMLLGILLFSACSSNKTQYEPIDEDFCAEIHFNDPHPLSEQLEPFSEISNSRTAVYSLEEGENAMIGRAWLCESAEKTIDIQYFIFSADNVGLIAVDYLLRAAESGVKVRIIVDDIMVKADADELLALDSHPNFSIKIYNPTINIGKNFPRKILGLTTNFRGVNQRMHNKTFIVDEKVVITGGRNIADEYFDYDHEYNFRDRDVLLIGKSVKEVSSSFEQFWDSELSVPVSKVVDAKDYNLNTEVKMDWIHQYACNPDNFWPQVRERIKAVPDAFQQIQESGDLVWVEDVNFVSDAPGKNDGSEGLAGGGICTDSLINLIKRAKKSIYIQSPYLITTELSQQLFRQAIDRGVSINILTNSLSSTDNLEAFNGYQRVRKILLEIGVNIYEFKPDAKIRYEVMTGALQQEIDFTPIFGLHAKSMVIDRKVSVIGTFNLDPRSANLNTECVAIIHDAKIGEKLFNAIEEDMKPENAWHTTLNFNPDSEAGSLKRFKAWMRGLVPKSIL